MLDCGRAVLGNIDPRLLAEQVQPEPGFLTDLFPIIAIALIYDLLKPDSHSRLVLVLKEVIDDVPDILRIRKK